MVLLILTGCSSDEKQPVTFDGPSYMQSLILDIKVDDNIIFI